LKISTIQTDTFQKPFSGIEKCRKLDNCWLSSGRKQAFESNIFTSYDLKVFPKGDSRLFLVFFPLPPSSCIFDIEAIYFSLIKDSQCINPCQNSLEALSDRALHFAQIFILAKMKSSFHSTKTRIPQPLLKI
jgi:hypothetical protein